MIIIKNGALVTPQGLRRADLAMEGDKIVWIAAAIEPAGGDTVEDAVGCWVFPGFIDAHTHFDLDVCNTTTADDFTTGSRAALKGGTTTVIDFACPNKGESLQYGLDLWHKKADGRTFCDYGFHMTIDDWNESIRAELPELEQIIVLGHIPLESGETAYGMLKRLGRDYLAGHKEEFLKIGQAIRNDDYATITYTSGTTADPKGVVLTHRNYTANVEQSLSRIDIPSSYRTLIILPLDHCFAHVVGFYIMIACGASVATVQIGATPMETLKNIPQNIREVKPNFLLSVPALAKNFRKNIETSIRAKGRFTERLFDFALRTAYIYNQDGYHKGKGWRILLAPVVGLFDLVLFRKVREAFGGSLEFFVGGGALLDSELQRFFYAIGIPMFQGYGLSEATPVISTNSPKYHWHKFGSSGKILEPLDLKILDEEGRELPRLSLIHI